MLSAEHVGWQSPSGCTILRDVSLHIEPGTLTALIGPSGAGKTTLLRSLCLLEPPTTGSIRVDGTTYSFPRPPGPLVPTPWPTVTAVFQNLFLWPHLTLRENILLPLNGQESVRLDPLIERFGMGEFIDRYPNETSVGQRQRVALVRASMLRPKYLLLDEVTSALDVEQIAVILEHLQALKAEGMGILLITHLLEFARHAAEQMVFIDDGTVRAAGTVEEILDRPSHERLSRFLRVVEMAR